MENSFGVVDDNIVIGDNFRGTVKDIDCGERLMMFTVLSDSVELNKTLIGVIY